jgi:hypothetical protein
VGPLSRTRRTSWPSTYSILVRAKLLFLGRLLRTPEEENPVIANMVSIRLEQVDQDDRNGFFGELCMHSLEIC